jgi:hypothetical protein
MIIFVFSNRFTLIFHGLSRVVWLFKLRLINFFIEKIVGMCVHALTHEIHLCTLDATSSWYHVSFHRLSDVPLLFFFLMVQRVLLRNKQFVTNWPFFLLFFFFYLQYLKNYRLVFVVFYISTSVFFLLIF